ncbi:cytochrome oxidase small assembly protein [Comamonas halotolerans]|uniref:cytochrome oxidase small assembly protein n=1 Tax=Comamonas halotolerans TaxID=3041496 RepID=UPI0039B79528
MIQAKHSNATSEHTQAWHLQRQRNVRMAVVLASIAVTFFLGFVGKMALLGG